MCRTSINVPTGPFPNKLFDKYIFPRLFFFFLLQYVKILILLTKKKSEETCTYRISNLVKSARYHLIHPASCQRVILRCMVLCKFWSCSFETSQILMLVCLHKGLYSWALKIKKKLLDLFTTSYNL